MDDFYENYIEELKKKFKQNEDFEYQCKKEFFEAMDEEIIKILNIHKTKED